VNRGGVGEWMSKVKNGKEKKKLKKYTLPKKKKKKKKKTANTKRENV